MSSKTRNSSKLQSREGSSTALKHRGAGDGAKTPGFKTERAPFPSSRKFTARLSKDHSTQLKLKKVLEDIESGQGRLQRAKSVAEITPTKTKLKLTKLEANSTITLLATPRPIFGNVNEVIAQRTEDRERRLCHWVYERFLVFVWRRSKIRLVKVSESLKMRQDQIFQLEQQVDCLKNLTQSECMKRTETSNECLQLRNMLETLERENKVLIQEKTAIEEELIKIQEALRQSQIDLENARNLVNSKDLTLQDLQNEFDKLRRESKNLQVERDSITARIHSQENVIKSQKGTIEKLEFDMKLINDQLMNSKSLSDAQMADYFELQKQYDMETSRNDNLHCELNKLYANKEEMENNIKYLEEKVVHLEQEMRKIGGENKVLKEDLDRFERESKLWRNVKEFVGMSWSILRNAAYIMLPAA